MALPDDDTERDDTLEAADDAPPTGGEQTDDTTDWKAEAEKWKSLSRKHEGQAKANATAAEELAAIKDKDKTETQKIAEERDTARSEADRANAALMRLEVVVDKGLPRSMAGRLQGTTKEELEADADELLAALRPDTGEKASDTQGRPKERLRSGTAPDTEPEETDPAKLAAMVPR